MFGLENWTELSRPRDSKTMFERPEYAKWRAFRDTEDSRFVTLVLPRVLARLPYGKSTIPIESFSFEELQSDWRFEFSGTCAILLDERRLRTGSQYDASCSRNELVYGDHGSGKWWHRRKPSGP